MKLFAEVLRVFFYPIQPFIENPIASYAVASCCLALVICEGLAGRAGWIEKAEGGHTFLLIPAAAWALYGRYESLLVGKGYDIRIDMFLITPALYLATAIGLVPWLQGIARWRVRLSPATVVAAVLGCGLIALGVLGFLSFRRQSIAAASVSWPTVPGQVKVSHIMSGGRWEGQANFYYTYVIEGHAYTGSRVSYQDPPYDSLNVALPRVVRQYPVGRIVDVHYDPRKPYECALEPHGSFVWCAVQWMIASGLVAAGILMAGALINRVRPPAS